MYILGINISHHSSMCLYKDESLIFYLECDRVTRIKESDLNVNSHIELLEMVLDHTSHIDHLILCSFGKKLFSDNPDIPVIENVKNKITEYGIVCDNFHFYDEHHLYHACNAFYSSGFEESAVLVLDGGGTEYKDYLPLREMESMYYFSDLKFQTIKKNYSAKVIFFNEKPTKLDENTIFSTSLSCGGLFNSLWYITGKEPGKIMGLSSYGNSKNLDTDDWFSFDKNTNSWYTKNHEILNCYTRYSGNCNLNFFVKKPFNQFEKIFKEKFEFEIISNIAKKIQEETRDHTIRLIEQVLQKCNTKNIVLSGGYMLNCVNNYEYLKFFPNINFYIDPISHDGGTCIGAVKYLWHHVLNNKKKEVIKTLYLG